MLTACTCTFNIDKNPEPEHRPGTPPAPHQPPAPWPPATRHPQKKPAFRARERSCPMSGSIWRILAAFPIATHTLVPCTSPTPTKKNQTHTVHTNANARAHPQRERRQKEKHKEISAGHVPPRKTSRFARGSSTSVTLSLVLPMHRTSVAVQAPGEASQSGVRRRLSRCMGKGPVSARPA